MVLGLKYLIFEETYRGLGNKRAQLVQGRLLNLSQLIFEKNVLEYRVERDLDMAKSSRR